MLLLAGFGFAVAAAVEVATGEWRTASLDDVLNNPVYLGLTLVGAVVTYAVSALVATALYVELRDWKDGPAAADLERIFA